MNGKFGIIGVNFVIENIKLKRKGRRLQLLVNFALHDIEVGIVHPCTTLFQAIEHCEHCVGKCHVQFNRRYNIVFFQSFE